MVKINNIILIIILLSISIAALIIACLAYTKKETAAGGGGVEHFTGASDSSGSLAPGAPCPAGKNGLCINNTCGLNGNRETGHMCCPIQNADKTGYACQPGPRGLSDLYCYMKVNDLCSKNCQCQFGCGTALGDYCAGPP